MKKIPCLFRRDFSGGRRPVLLSEVTPGCDWVLVGEGVPTRKRDGTAVLVRQGKLYTRLDCKKGKAPPPGALPCDPEPDPVTGHWPHWVEATRPEDRWVREAAANLGLPPSKGTYEALGPRINGNHEHLASHILVRHGAERWDDVPRNFDGLRAFLAATPDVEGIVFHHPDGRMAKIRRDDFGLDWPSGSREE